MKDKKKSDPLLQDDSNLSGYELLAIAIVNQAAMDYRDELKLSMKQNCKTTGAIAIERFLQSDYGDLLSFGLGEYILETIQKEVEAGKDKKKTIFFCKKQPVK